MVNGPPEYFAHSISVLSVFCTSACVYMVGRCWRHCPTMKYWVNVGLPRFRAASVSSCRWSSGRRCPSALFASPCFSRDNQGRTTRTPSLATRWGPRRRLWFPRFATWLQSELGIMELELWMDLMQVLFGRTCWTFTALTFLFVWICRTLNFISVYFGCAAARNDES